MNENVKKLASEALSLQRKIKSDTEKLKKIKEAIIKESHGANRSYRVNLMDGSIRVTKSKKLRSFLLNKKKFANFDIQLKKKLVRNRVIKLSYTINPEVYQKLLEENLIDKIVQDVVAERQKQPFFVSIYLNKSKEKVQNNQEEEIIELAEDEIDEEEDSEVDYMDDLFIKSIFTDDDPADMSETEKQEKGFE